jgi:hypothetical protein
MAPPPLRGGRRSASFGAPRPFWAGGPARRRVGGARGSFRIVWWRRASRPPGPPWSRGGRADWRVPVALRRGPAPVAWVCDAPSRWCCRRGGASERRASGGCLGVERRRRTWHAAKSPGEPRAGFDPGISEWGNPPQRWGTVTRIHSVAGRTRGTETSQYPEERTSTETPSVAASERGPGQWPKAQNRKGMESPPTAGDRPVRVERPSVLE